MKKMCALLLVLAVLMTCMAPALAADKVPVTWLGYYTSDFTIPENTWAEQLLETYFPDVDIIPVTTVNQSTASNYINTAEVLEATIVAGQYIIGKFSVAELLDQEILRTIPMEWLEECYPDGLRIVKTILGENVIEESGYAFNGEAAIIPQVTKQSFAPVVTMYRKDWLENLGMKEPTTMQEFHDMLYAFTYNDPDGNGVDDTYGWDPSLNYFGPAQIFGNFGFAHDFNMNPTFEKHEDGSVTFTAVTEEYKQALTMMKAWYDEGILAPECITDNRSDIRSKWVEGKIGVMGDTWSWTMSSRGVQGVIGMVEAVHGEGVVGILGPMTTNDGDGNVYSYLSNAPFIKTGFFITADATEDQIKAALRILNEIAKDDDLYFQLAYGEKGVDWFEAEDNKITVAPESSELEYQVSKGVGTFFGQVIADEERLARTLPEVDVANLSKAGESKLTVSGRNFGNVSNEAYDTYYAEVKKLYVEYAVNVLLGNANLDADWDQYVKNMDQAGLSKILKGFEEALAK